VIIADADALSPTAVVEIRLPRDIFKSAVTPVLVKVIGRLPALAESFQDGSIDQKNVQKAIVVIVEERHAAAGSFQQVLVGLLSPEHRNGVQSCLAGDIGKRELERLFLPYERNRSEQSSPGHQQQKKDPNQRSGNNGSLQGYIVSMQK